MKLTQVMMGTLSEADDRGEIGYSACARLGGSGRTLGALVDRGLLVRVTYSNGHRWAITESGRAALKDMGE